MESTILVDQYGKPFGSSGNPLNVSLTGSNTTLKYVSVSGSDSVAAGASENVQFVVPSGKIWRTIGFTFSIDPVPSSTTGTHTVSFNLGTSLQVPMAEITQAYNVRLQYVFKAFWNGSTGAYYATGVYPDDHNAQAQLFDGLLCSADAPLTVQYTNNTDQVQTNGRYYDLIVEERPA